MDIEKELVEVRLLNDDDFLKVKETLTRIGIPDHANSSLTQSCHILHKRGKYYIVHFLQMFMLDGKHSTFSLEDKARLNYIVSLLLKWNLIEVVDPKQIESPILVGKVNIKVIPYKEKSKWALQQKYTLGGKQ